MGPGVPSPGSRRSLWLALLLTLLAVGLHAHALQQPFFLSDYERLIDTPTMIIDGAFQPATWLVLRLAENLLGLWPGAFRLINLLALAAAGLLLARWVRSFTPHRGFDWAAALLFVAHPAHARSITELAGLCDLLAIVGVLGFAATQRHAQLQQRWTVAGLVAGLGFAALAMGARATGLALIPLALLQCYLASRPQVAAPGKSPSPTHHSLGPTLALLALPAVLMLTLRFTLDLHWPKPMDLTENPLLREGWTARLPAGLALLPRWLGQMLWPLGLPLLPPQRTVTFAQPDPWLGVLILAVMIAGLTDSLCRLRWTAAAWVLGISHALIAGHLLWAQTSFSPPGVYLPISAAALVWLAVILSRRARSDSRTAAVVLVTVIVLLLPLAVRSAQLQRYWSREQVLSVTVYNRQPDHPIAAYGLARALSAVGQHRRARDLHEAVVAAQPRSAQAQRGLASELVRLGDYELAEQALLRVLDLDPDNPEVLLDLARVMVAHGKRDEAAEKLRALLRDHPDDPLALEMLRELRPPATP